MRCPLTTELLATVQDRSQRSGPTSSLIGTESPPLGGFFPSPDGHQREMSGGLLVSRAPSEGPENDLGTIVTVTSPDRAPTRRSAHLYHLTRKWRLLCQFLYLLLPPDGVPRIHPFSAVGNGRNGTAFQQGPGPRRRLRCARADGARPGRGRPRRVYTIHGGGMVLGNARASFRRYWNGWRKTGTPSRSGDPAEKRLRSRPCCYRPRA